MTIPATDCAVFSRTQQATRSRQGWWPVGLFAALTTVVTLLFSSVAFAHSGLGAASPGPGAVVGGEITTIQLRYASTITDPDGSVTDPNGEIVGSRFTQDGNLKVIVSLDAPLSVPGQYAVAHISTDVEDDDRVAAAYLFTYDPAAPPPQLEIIAQDDGFPWAWVVVGVGGSVIVVLAWRLSASLKRARSGGFAADG